MCGITSLIHLSGLSIDPSLLLGMHQAIKHRGRDDQGVFIDRDIGLSNRRLRIIGEKNEGRQPIHFKERYHFVFNGTLYNYKALAEKLKAKKSRKRSQTSKRRSGRRSTASSSSSLTSSNSRQKAIQGRKM